MNKSTRLMVCTSLLLSLVAGSNEEVLAKNKPAVKAATHKKAPKKVPSEQPARFSPGDFLIVTVPGPQLDTATAGFLNRQKPAGVILLGESVQTDAQTSALIRAIKKAEGMGEGLSDPPLIAIDQEGGEVNRLHLKEAPSAAELGMAGNLEHTREVARAYARACRKLGIGIVLAPVLDVFVPGANAFLKERCFGVDPNLVAKMGVSFSRGIIEEGLLPVVKHFPGHGAAQQDSHRQMAVSKLDGKNLLAALLPFRLVTLQDHTGVMAGHISCKAMDPEGAPASLSSTILRNTLRSNWEFDGLIITDDLNMAGIRQQRPLSAAVVQALAAGNDLALVCATDPGQLNSICSAIAEAERNGTLSEENLKKSKERIESVREFLRKTEKRTESPARETHPAKGCTPPDRTQSRDPIDAESAIPEESPLPHGKAP